MRYWIFPTIGGYELDYVALKLEFKGKDIKKLTFPKDMRVIE